MAVENQKRSAIILVGGNGTRLRPLTHTKPKPLISFANKPILFHQIDFLYKEGVTRIVLATNNKHDLKDALSVYDKHINLEIMFSIEEKPLGTAGPLLLARNMVTYPCYVLNSDVICHFPLSQLMTYHQIHKRAATLLATTVKDPSKYGVMKIDTLKMSILSFIEKPQEYVGNRINAGVYVIEERVIDNIMKEECSIEKEVFPILAEKNELTYYDLEGYWMDIGQPRDYLEGVRLYIKHGIRCYTDMCIKGDSIFFNTKHERVNFEEMDKSKNIDFYSIDCGSSFSVEKSLINRGVKIGIGCEIGPNVIIGDKVKIGNYVKIVDSTLLDGACIEDGCYIKTSIVGWNCNIRKWARLDNYTVLGEEVEVGEAVSLNNAIIEAKKKVLTDSSDCYIK